MKVTKRSLRDHFALEEVSSEEAGAALLEDGVSRLKERLAFRDEFAKQARIAQSAAMKKLAKRKPRMPPSIAKPKSRDNIEAERDEKKEQALRERNQSATRRGTEK